MAGITAAQAQTKLDEYLAAETAVLSGQEVMLDGDKLTLADLDKIQKGIEIWNARSISLAGTGLSVRTVIPT